jgi:two-component system cell cycle response regulator DivK
MYADYLRALAFAVIDADSVATATPLVEGVDIVVTDLGLARDRLAGLELIERIRSREETRRLPLIVVTANGVAQDRERVLDAGCNSYLVKPCLPDALAAEIQRLLEPGVVDQSPAAGP